MAHVRLFASLRELTGTSTTDLPGHTVRDVLDAAATRYGPEFARQVQHCRVILDGDRVDDLDTPLGADSEVAILPPVAGG